jgi:hypothetical protein
MAIISDELRYLFVHAPRTGGTAVSGVLTSNLQGRRIPGRKITVVLRGGGSRTVRQHITVPQLLEASLVTPEQLQRFLVFTTVRNPFDSLVSSYVKKRDLAHDFAWATNHPVTRMRVGAAAELSFPDYIEREYAERAPRHLYSSHLRGASLVMRFEHLADDLAGVCRALGTASPDIPLVNTTPRERDYKSYYTARAHEIVARVFAPDLERFGYEF